MEEVIFNCDPLEEPDLEAEWFPLGRAESLSENAFVFSAFFFVAFCLTPESLEIARLVDVSGSATFVASGDIPGGAIGVAGMVSPRKMPPQSLAEPSELSSSPGR